MMKFNKFAYAVVNIFLLSCIVFALFTCRDQKDFMEYRGLASAGKTQLIELHRTHQKNLESLKTSHALFAQMSKISENEPAEFDSHVKSFEGTIDSVMLHYAVIRSRLEAHNFYSHHNTEKSIIDFISFLEREQHYLAIFDSSLLSETKYFKTIKLHKKLKNQIDVFSKNMLQNMPKIINSLDSFRNDVKSMNEDY
jgi:hypothetical protein